MTSLTPGRFRQADAIFDAVLELEAAERAAFVERACEGDPALRSLVLRLLRAYQHADDFLGVPALELARPLLEGAQPAARHGRSMPLPERIGSYRIIRELGRGGMGVVYLAEREAGSGAPVALKVLRGGERIAGSELRRFLAERRILSGLEHPFVARLLETGTTPDGTPWFAMAHCAGGSLAERLEAGPLPVADALRIARQLAEALEAAHAIGVVHRDVKPANVLFSADGDVQLTDFGVAKLLDQESTQSGSMLGTPAYLAPEQLRGARVDHRADLWALGVTLHEMVTGRRPFEGTSYAAILHAVLSLHAPSLRRGAQELPPALDGLCQHLLAKDPDARPESAGEVASVLGRIAATPDLVYRVPGLSSATPTTTPGGRPRSVSVVVLPFVTMSGNPDDIPFSDGLTDALTVALGRVRGLRVTARTTAFALRAKGLDARVIANVLGVSFVVEGTVRRGGDRFRVSVQLVEAANATVTWSETWDRRLQDVFELEEELARAIVAALAPALTIDLARPTAPIRDVATYELFLKGCYFLERRTAADLHRALQYFEQAIARDPAYIEAHAAAADTRVFMLTFGNGSPIEHLPVLRASVARAMALGAGSAAVHATHGNFLQAYEWRWRDSELELRHALELDASLTAGWRFLAVLLAQLGRVEQCVQLANRCLALDPLSPTFNLVLGRAHMHAGRLDEALRSLRTAVEIAPDFAFAQTQLGFGLMLAGRPGEALDAFRRAADGGGLNERGQLAWACGRAGDLEAAAGILDDLLRLGETTYLPPFGMAHACVGTRQVEAAIDWLERGEQERAPLMNTVKVAPGLASLHGHLRFDALLQRMALDDRSLASGT